MVEECTRSEWWSWAVIRRIVWFLPQSGSHRFGRPIELRNVPLL